MYQLTSKQECIDGYTIHYDRIIGQGAFAVCYDCENKLIPQPLCVKTILIDQQQNKYLVDREVKILLTLQSKNNCNIIKIFHITQKNNYCYIFMEKCLKGNLLQYYQCEQMTLKIILQLLKSIIKGYQVLYTNSIIHRDLKPQNILIGNDGEIKITDYGLSKLSQNIETIQLQTMAGTQLYMAPQLLTDGKYSAKCDVFSLGVIIYELIFRTFPFYGQNLEEQIQLHQTIQTTPISIPCIELIGELYEKQKLEQFLKNSLVYSEEFRLSWDSLFLEYFQITQSKSIHEVQKKQVVQLRQVREPAQSGQKKRTRTKSETNLLEDQNIKEKIIQQKPRPVQKHNIIITEISEMKTQGLMQNFEQIVSPKHFTNPIQKLLFKKQGSVSKLIKVILIKYDFVHGFISQLELLKQKYRILFLKSDFLIFKFLLIGYQYSILLNIFDIITGPETFKKAILLYKEIQAHNIELQITQYKSNQKQEIKQQQTQLQQLFESHQAEFNSMRENLLQLMQQLQDDSLLQLKQFISKPEQFYNYSFFLQEFQKKFHQWRKGFWDKDSKMDFETLKFIAYAIKFSYLEQEYSMFNFEKIDSIVVNENQLALKEYINNKMPF